jgi:AcrR family transcriptional regulator
MTESMLGRREERREAAQREVLDAAWRQLEQHGVAALSLRELARTLGIRPQSLAHYFPTKPALLDALFRDGFSELGARMRCAPCNDDPTEALIATVQTILELCAASPARYHLMLQRTVPGFTPTDESHEVALTALGHLFQRLNAAGVNDPADIDVFRGLVNGLAAEQIANDPGGRRFIDQAEHAVRVFLAGAAAVSHRPAKAKKVSTDERHRTAPRPADRT